MTMDSNVSRDAEELRRRVLAEFDRLSLARGATLGQLLGVVANSTGRRIEIDPIGTREWETVTGLVVLDEGEAHVYVRKSDPRWYQFHSVLHELSHLILGHTGCTTLPSSHRTGVTARAGQTMLARSTVEGDFESAVDFSDGDMVREAEAEKLSQLLSQRMLGPKHLADEAVLG